MRILQPQHWPRPRGYSNGIEAEGRLIFVAGQIGWDDTGQFKASSFAGQFRQALANTLTVLKEAPAFVEAHVSLATIYYRQKRKLDGDKFADETTKLLTAGKQ